MLGNYQFQMWRLDVLNYAEWEKGLDPIGASDMLADLSTFCAEEFIARLEDGAETLPDPKVTWELFKSSNFWLKYYPPTFDYEG